MPPKGSSTKLSPPRLPPLPKLRVRRPNQPGANPCVGIMTSVLGCWASSGNAAAGCAQLEQQLRACMDASVRTSPLPFLQLESL
ncbi:40S ribosomal protein mrp10 [Lecanora helva]